jgi:cytochrome P450
VTIASMLDIAIFFLAKHPEIQEKAFEEIQVKSKN